MTRWTLLWTLAELSSSRPTRIKYSLKHYLVSVVVTCVLVGLLYIDKLSLWGRTTCTGTAFLRRTSDQTIRFLSH
jgi:hypothetical protein